MEYRLFARSLFLPLLRSSMHPIPAQFLTSHYLQILSHHPLASKIVLTLSPQVINSFFCLKISERTVISSPTPYSLLPTPAPKGR